MQAVQNNTITESSRFLKRLHDPSRPVLVFDGATGTSLQQLDLSADDFGGEALEGCNENLVITRPDAVQAVHRQFLDAGCDVIETDTFGAASVVLAEYGLEDHAFALNKRAAELAREMADQYSTADKPRFVAGSMGPTTKLPTLGHIDFDTLRTSFRDQAAGLLAGDVDLFIIETCQDVLQIKAALQGVEDAFEASGERRPDGLRDHGDHRHDAGRFRHRSGCLHPGAVPNRRSRPELRHGPGADEGAHQIPVRTLTLCGELHPQCRTAGEHRRRGALPTHANRTEDAVDALRAGPRRTGDRWMLWHHPCTHPVAFRDLHRIDAGAQRCPKASP